MMAAAVAAAAGRAWHTAHARPCVTMLRQDISIRMAALGPWLEYVLISCINSHPTGAKDPCQAGSGLLE